MKKGTITFVVIAIVLPLMVVAFVVYLNPKTDEADCVSTVYLQFIGLPETSASFTYTTITNSSALVGQVVTTTFNPVNQGAQVYHVDETCTFVSK